MKEQLHKLTKNCKRNKKSVHLRVGLAGTGAITWDAGLGHSIGPLRWDTLGDLQHISCEEIEKKVIPSHHRSVITPEDVTTRLP